MQYRIVFPLNKTRTYVQDKEWINKIMLQQNQN